MNNNEFKNIIGAVKSIKLSENEKATMKSNIISGVIPSEFYNVTKSTPSRLYYMSDIVSHFNLFTNQNNFMPALFIAVILALTGGTSVVAEKAIPGDALYQMKVSFNEPVAGLFAVGKESKAVWQERLVERRLDEVQKVIAQGTVSTSTQAELQTNVSNQIDKVSLAVKDLSENKDNIISSSELAVRLESALQAHQDIIERATSEGKIATSTKETAKVILATLKEKEDVVKNDRDKIELSLGDGFSNNASTTPAAALNKQVAAEKILGNVKTKYQEERNNLATSTINNVNQKLIEAEKTLTSGKANITSGNYEAARDDFQDVIKSANQTRSEVLTGSIKSHIEDDMKINHEENKNNERDDSQRINSTSTNSTSTIRSDDNENKNESKNENRKDSKRVEVEED